MICVSAGKSVGEIACRRCEGMWSRGKVVGWLKRRSLDTSAFVRWGAGGLEFGAKNMLADGFGFICEAKSISSQCH